MWIYPTEYDVIVIGAGHAGCEAAHAAAKMGTQVLLLTMSPDTIAKMSCNPAIGGTAKGHIVREIDALGGLMGKIADQSAIQRRMLNASKGPAVWAPRAQTDKLAYQTLMKHRLEQTQNLHIKQGTIHTFIVEGDRIRGVCTQEGIGYRGEAVILSAGTFMRGLIHIGGTQFEGGRAGDKASLGLSGQLEALGFSLGRLKTGTPPRIHRRSIDCSVLEEQPGESDVLFSHDAPQGPGLPQVSCYIAHTNEKTKQLIRDNLHRSPLYSGVIQGVGPRYCPSIEDKVVRFADRQRHQLFLEPEGLQTEEIYVNGLSSSLPFDVQLAMLHTIDGLQRAEIIRPAYAIEYDYVRSGQLSASLETTHIEGLFFAGQVNGTTGYEEAAGQGLIAGINAASKVLGRSPLVLQRSEAYIGVMIDELITKELDEPYRMFTSRAEHRLLLRQDNADMRLRPYGHSLGLISEAQFAHLQRKRDLIAAELRRLGGSFHSVEGRSVSLAQLLCRPEYTYATLREELGASMRALDKEVELQVELQLKYAGYIKRQEQEVAKLQAAETSSLPRGIDFFAVQGLSREAQEKLTRFRPLTFGQASRISGVSPADISILMVATKR